MREQTCFPVVYFFCSACCSYQHCCCSRGLRKWKWVVWWCRCFSRSELWHTGRQSANTNSGSAADEAARGHTSSHLRHKSRSAASFPRLQHSADCGNTERRGSSNIREQCDGYDLGENQSGSLRSQLQHHLHCCGKRRSGFGSSSGSCSSPCHQLHSRCTRLLGLGQHDQSLHPILDWSSDQHFSSVYRRVQQQFLDVGGRTHLDILVRNRLFRHAECVPLQSLRAESADHHAWLRSLSSQPGSVGFQQWVPLHECLRCASGCDLHRHSCTEPHGFDHCGERDGVALTRRSQRARLVDFECADLQQQPREACTEQDWQSCSPRSCDHHLLVWIVRRRQRAGRFLSPQLRSLRCCYVSCLCSGSDRNWTHSRGTIVDSSSESHLVYCKTGQKSLFDWWFLSCKSHLHLLSLISCMELGLGFRVEWEQLSSRIEPRIFLKHDLEVQDEFRRAGGFFWNLLNELKIPGVREGIQCFGCRLELFFSEQNFTTSAQNISIFWT